MNKKVVILGGGTGTSTLVRGLKQFPVDISVVVSVCDDGSSTGILRKEFDVPAVGDLRKVIAALSKTEPLFEKLLEYRFKTTSDLNGHTVGNLLLVALCNITGNMSDGIESLSKVLNIEGNVLPLTEDNVTLVGKMRDESIIEGEHNITESKIGIKDIHYKEVPVINPLVIKQIKEADMIILSMGSLYTSIICNLISEDVINAIDNSKGKIVYVCNMFTQPGETDEFTVGNHIEILNEYLGKRKVETVIVNDGEIPKKYIDKYHREEEKDPVVIDIDNLNKMNIKVITDDFINLQDGTLKHDTIKLSFKIFEELVFDWKLDNNYNKKIFDGQKLKSSEDCVVVYSDKDKQLLNKEDTFTCCKKM